MGSFYWLMFPCCDKIPGKSKEGKVWAYSLQVQSIVAEDLEQDPPQADGGWSRCVCSQEAARNAGGQLTLFHSVLWHGVSHI